MITLRHVAFGFAIILSIFVIFLTYYKPNFKLPALTFYQERVNISCQCANTSCPSDLQVTPTPTDVKKNQVDTRPDTIVLLWMWPFGVKHPLSCDEFNITGCHVTVDKSVYHQAHGVLFHHRDIGNTVMPTELRPWFQKWIWFNMESPVYSGVLPSLDNVFNLTMSYRLDSTILIPYGTLELLQSKRESLELPAKNKLLCWIVSHWEQRLERVRYFQELKKYINVSLYGNAFGNAVGDDDYKDIVSSCKFYLAFENSVCKDYISEKLFLPLELGTVPVVLGPPRKNYERVVPPDSFIHVDDFSSPKQLVERLLYLDQNNEEYLKLLEWKNWFKVIHHKFGHEAACKTCRYLQINRGYQVFHNLNKWYWD
ncbi:alpha-(1,3)-fucosyltransferase 9-like [Cynoglossus semilaevis]|uniref:Fucosyltransferase n=1 Tax=Cynoglossus semilaevis TaxID=244447 RepID=A0A3P8V3V8_CYNSE|nr:alpha-(1,3)-fucosyltransferase 9-like [Cynoglossus semilaevis]